jgi:hypothetical protein
VSIYGTEATFWLEDEDTGHPIEIDVQMVASFIDADLPYLPPPRPEIPEADGYSHPRAVFFCAPWTTKGDPGKGGQEYSNYLLMLPGADYETMPFREVFRKLAEAIRAHQSGEEP